MFTTLAKVSIERLDRFIEVFSTAGLAARRAHGSLAAQAFCEAGDEHTAWVLIDWTDRASFERFVADPQVKATMRSGGARGAPEFVTLQRWGHYDS